MDALFLGEWEAYLRYLDLPGSEPAAVFIPGAWLSGTGSFVPLAVENGLARRRRIIVDLLGGGYSDRPADFGYSLEDHAVTIASLLDDLGLQGCVVIGHSLGGAVAIELAAKRPDLVGCLILAEANLDAVGGAYTQFVTSYSEADFVASGYAALMDEMQRQAHSGDGASGVPMTYASLALGILGVADPRALHRSAVGLARGTSPIMRDLLGQMTIPRLYGLGSGRSRTRTISGFPDRAWMLRLFPRPGMP